MLRYNINVEYPLLALNGLSGTFFADFRNRPICIGVTLKAGAADYLQKPVNFYELMIRLDRIDTFKSLSKRADDLREAMDVTECAAVETIQTLELKAAALQDALLKIEAVVRQSGLAPAKRLEIIGRHLDSGFTEVL